MLCTWIFYSKSANKRINHEDKRTLSLVHDDYILTFGELFGER